MTNADYVGADDHAALAPATVTQPYYADDLVTLYLGDCREITAWLAADVLVCDPPYGIGYQQGGPRSNVDGVRSVTPTARVIGDADTTVRDTVLALWGTERAALVFGSWKVPRPQNVRQRLVWFKRNTNPGLGTGTPWSPADEEIYVLGAGWIGPRELNVLVTDEARASAGGLAAMTGHPTPKPVGAHGASDPALPAGCRGGPVRRLRGDPAGRTCTRTAGDRRGDRRTSLRANRRAPRARRHGLRGGVVMTESTCPGVGYCKAAMAGGGQCGKSPCVVSERRKGG